MPPNRLNKQIPIAYQDFLLSNTNLERDDPVHPGPPPHSPQRLPPPLQHVFSPLTSLIQKTLNSCHSHILGTAGSKSQGQKDLSPLITMDMKAEDHRWEYSQAWLDKTTEYQRQSGARQWQRHAHQHTEHAAVQHNKSQVHASVSRYFLPPNGPSLGNLTLFVPEIICVDLKHLLPVHNAHPSPRMPSKAGQTSVADSPIRRLGMWSFHRYNFRTR